VARRPAQLRGRPGARRSDVAPDPPPSGGLPSPLRAPPAAASRPWNRRDLDEGWGYQNRIIDPDSFERWFYNDSCSAVPIQVERIPPHWAGMI
jgi:hypothetical protein